MATRASGHAERLAVLALIEPYAVRPRPVTLSADKGYDSGDFVMELRGRDRRPHHTPSGYAISLRIRKRVAEAFGWAKTVAGLRKLRYRGLPKVGWQFTLAMAAYDLARRPKLLAATTP